MQNQLSQTKQYYHSLHFIQDQVKASLAQIISILNAIIIIGDTGQGKSTLLHFIAKNQLIAEKSKFLQKIHLKAAVSLGNIEIGEGSQSKTIVPNKWVDSKGLVYYDYPGFNDTKGVQQDIVNGFYIKTIIDKAEKVKFLIVISQSTIQGRAEKFIGVLKKLQNLLANFEQIMQSICLVLTQTQMKTADEFRQFLLEEFIPKQGQYLSQKQQLLIEYFASGDGHVGIFRSPQEQGCIDMNESQKIMDLIELLEFVRKPQIRITVSPDSLLALQRFGQIINSEIEALFQSSNKNIEILCRQIIKEELDYKSSRQRLFELGKSIKAIKDSKQVDNFIQSCIKLFIGLKLDSKLVQSLETNFKLLQFICEIMPQTQISNHKWISAIFVDNLIEKLTNEPEIIQSMDNAILTIKCSIIGIRKLQQIIEEKGTNKVKYVQLFCFHTFYIDADLFTPGINLSIFAKFWKIHKNFKISLKGLNAKHYTSPAPNAEGTDQHGHGLKGYNGYPGKPGQTGGSFLGKIMSKKINLGPKNLQIDVSGGNGGNGQDAGNGSKGSDGKDASETPVLQRDKKCLQNRQQYKLDNKPDQQKIIALVKKLGTFNNQKVQTYVSKGKKGKSGGSSGKRGVGGMGGYSGIVSLQNFKADIENADGQCGKNGELGKPGKGGKNGKDFKGQYINEIMFGSFREQGKKIDDKKIIQEEKDALTKGILGNLLPTIIPAKLAVGIASFGITFGAQVVASALSANYSSQWLYTGYVDGGYASDGKVTQQLNLKNWEEPDQPFSIRDSYKKNMEKLYECFCMQLINSIGYKTSFFL